MSGNQNRFSLFRPEVAAVSGNQWLGQIVLLQPISFRLMALFAVTSSISILLFLFCAHYTKRAQVTGVLLPDTGLIRVQSQQPGIILERRVREGQTVVAGDVLFVVSGEVNVAGSQHTLQSVGSSAGTLYTLQTRRQNLQEERTQQAHLFDQQSAQLRRNIDSLQNEIQQAEREITLQEKRMQSAQIQYQNQQRLAEQGYVTQSALQQKQDEWIDQQGRLQTMQRSRTALLRDLTNVQTELATLPGKQQREQNQLLRQTLELDQQSLAAETRRQFLITAPQAGTVSAILADPGQTATNQTLLTIIPANAQLEAQLFVPSRAAGFIQPGQTVLLRYAAYPFQKFGQHRGRVSEISRTVIPQGELPVGFGTQNESLYRIRVQLDSQTILAYGKHQVLSAGMQLDADILQESRSLFDWLLDPLYTLKGNL